MDKGDSLNFGEITRNDDFRRNHFSSPIDLTERLRGRFGRIEERRQPSESPTHHQLVASAASEQHHHEITNDQRKTDEEEDDDVIDHYTNRFNIHEEKDKEDGYETNGGLPPLPSVTTNNYNSIIQNSSNHHQRHEYANPPPPLPPSAPRHDVLYVPYKYSVDEEAGIFRIFTRSTDGKNRRVFTLNVKPWSFLDMPYALDNPARTVSILKDELSTDRIQFDPNTNHFSVEPSSRLTNKVKESCRRIVNVPLTTYSILVRFGHRFFDLLHDDGRWAKKDTSSSSSGAGGGNAHRKAAFKTIVFSQIDNDTIAFIKNSPSFHPIVEVWTIYSAFSSKEHSKSAVNSLISDFESKFKSEMNLNLFDIHVQNFRNSEEMIREFCKMVHSYTDILIHYGEQTGAGTIIHHLSTLFSDNLNTVEIFDMHDYIRSVYTDMPSHSFTSVINEIDTNPQKTGEDQYEFEKLLTNSCINSLSPEQFSDSGDFLPDLRTTVHSSENISFFLEKIASKIYIMSRLFSTLSKSAFDLAYFSGCNISTLTKPNHASRGVIAFIDPIAAWSKIVDTLPHDYMKPGLHPLTYVTPFSGILIDNMCASEDPLTVSIGSKIDPIKSYGWIVREIFCMRDLSPIPPIDIQNVFALFRGMVYSTSEIPGYETIRQWSSIINVGMNSWIGISMSLPSDAEEAMSRFDSINETRSSITFGY